MRYFNSKGPFLIKLLVFVILIFPGCQNLNGGKIIESVYPNDSEKISAFGWVGVNFSKQVIKETAEDAFSITPNTRGEFIWEGNTLRFRTIQAFDLDAEYFVRLSGEIRLENGKLISVDRSWKFTIREPDLIYFVPSYEGGEIWRASPDGGQAQQLTFTGNRVWEFSPDRSGSAIAYTVQNETGGGNLWLMNRDGEEQELLLDCERDICGEPSWSMDNQRMAYTRQVYQHEFDRYQPAQIWTVDIETGETAQLYQSDWEFGHSPYFSPDGNRLAFYDTINKGIRILDLTTSQESIVPSALLGSGDWSPDGSEIIFTDLVPAENEPFVVLKVLDLETKVVETVLDVGMSDTDFSQPRWSPDGESIAVSLRPVNSNISKTLWVLRLDGLVSRQVTDDPSATFTGYEWDPWGDRLIFQRYKLGSAEKSIWLWESGEVKQIIEKGSRPKWLP